MIRAMQVTIGVEISEEEVKDYVKRYGGNLDEIDDTDWCEYAAIKYGIGLGAEARFCK